MLEEGWKDEGAGSSLEAAADRKDMSNSPKGTSIPPSVEWPQKAEASSSRMEMEAGAEDTRRLRPRDSSEERRKETQALRVEGGKATQKARNASGSSQNNEMTCTVVVNSITEETSNQCEPDLTHPLGSDELCHTCTYRTNAEGVVCNLVTSDTTD